MFFGEGVAQILCLYKGNGKPPVYCMPTVAGSVSSYEELATVVGLDRSVFGIRAFDREHTSGDFTSLREMAASITAAIEEQHPQGPIYLLGYSFGGPLAVEVARQLVERGQLVPLVAIVDQPPTRSSFGYLFRIIHFLKHAGPWVWQIGTRFVKDANQRSNYWKAIYQRLRRKRKLETEVWFKGLAEDRQNYVKQNMSVWRNFRFEGRYVGDILLLRQSPSATKISDPIRLRQLADYGWHKITGANVLVVYLPGNHASLMTHPAVERLGSELRRAFNKRDLLDHPDTASTPD
jgi:thioesterase domain-containing protein